MAKGNQTSRERTSPVIEATKIPDSNQLDDESNYS